MFANFLIGLREGLEAALIVAILVAYVVKLDQRQLLPRLWAGVALAVVLSLGAGALLTSTTASLSDAAAETFAGVTSVAAVGLITWMFFWTGIALVVIAGGVLRYAIHEFQEVGILPGMDDYVFDLTGQIDPAGWFATLIRGLFNITPAMTALEIFGWLAYIIIVMTLFVRTVRSSGPKAAAVVTQPLVRSGSEC